MTSILKTNGLTRRFGKLTAVDGLDLSVPEGSIFAFLGPNGAGKTTTIKTMMNIIEPSAGSATVLNVVSTRLGPAEFARIGYVSENQEMPDWMTVRQFLDYCKPMYPDWDDGFCAHLLRQFALPLDQKLRSFSRGMRMKAALLSSLAYRPRLLILDEPFSGLDPLVRDEFITAVLKLTQQENWTVFISSHDIDEVERLANWVAIIDNGTLKLVEETDTLLSRFRRLVITADDAADIPTAFPDTWLRLSRDGRVVTCIHSAYVEGRSEAEVELAFGGRVSLDIAGMTLREIFVTLAQSFKLQGMGGTGV